GCRLWGAAGVGLRRCRVAMGRFRPRRDGKAAARLLILAGGAVLLFACLFNNKVPVYMPHLLMGFALAAGFAVSEVSALLPGFAWVGPASVAFYAIAGVAYYEKWYSSAAKSELVPYERTEATLRKLVPPGAK